MKKFNLSKGLLVGLLTLALCFTCFGAVKVKADAFTAKITFTLAYKEGTKTTNYTTTYEGKEAGAEISLSTIEAAVKDASGKTLVENSKTGQLATTNAVTGTCVGSGDDKLAWDSSASKFTVGTLTANQTWNVTINYDATYTGTAKLTVSVVLANGSAADGTNMTYTYTVDADKATTEDKTIKYADIVNGAKRSATVDGETVEKTIADDFPDGVTIKFFGTVKNGSTMYYDASGNKVTDNATAADKMITSVSPVTAENAAIVLKKQTSVTDLGELTATLTVRRNKINAVFTTTVGSKNYIAKVKIPFVDQYHAVSVKASDILNAFVTNDTSATPLSEVGAYVITAIGGNDVDDYLYEYKVRFEGTACSDKTGITVTLAEAVTSVNYSPDNDEIYFYSPVKNVPIYWADVKKAEGAKLKGDKFKTVTTDSDNRAAIPLNDKSKGLKVGENKSVYIYYTGLKPGTTAETYSPNFQIDATPLKKFTLVPNYALADPSVWYQTDISKIAVGSIVLEGVDKTKTALVAGSADADTAKAFVDAIGKLQYSKDQKIWYDLTDDTPVYDGYAADTESTLITVDCSAIKYDLVDNLFFKWTGSGVANPDANYKLVSSGQANAELMKFFQYSIKEGASEGLSVAMNETFTSDFVEMTTGTHNPWGDATAVTDIAYVYKKGWYKNGATTPTDLSSVVSKVEGYYGAAIPEGASISLTYSQGNSGGITPVNGSELLITWVDGASVTEALNGTYIYHEGWFKGSDRVDDERMAEWFVISGETAGATFTVQRAALQTAEDFGLSITVAETDADGEAVTALSTADNFCIGKFAKGQNAFSGTFLYDISRAKSTIYFRYLGTPATSGANAENAVRNSKAVKVAIKAAAAKKEVKLDVAKDSLALKNGYDFAVSTEKVVPELSEWKTILPFNKAGQAENHIINTSSYVPAKKLDETNGTMFTTNKVKTVTLATIIEGFENLAVDQTRYVWVRKSASTTAPAQVEFCIEIKARTAAPTLTEANLTKLKVASSYTGTHYAIGDEKGVMILPAIKNASADKNAASYEFLVVNAADDGKVDFSSAKWSKAAAGTKIVGDKSKSKYKLTTDAADAKATDHVLADGDFIYLRRAGVKGKVVASQVLKLQVKKVKITPADTSKEAYETYCLVR